MYLVDSIFLTALGLRCFAQALSSCGERGLPFVVVRGLRIAVASMWSMGSRAQALQMWHTGLVAPPHIGFSWIRD